MFPLRKIFPVLLGFFILTGCLKDQRVCKHAQEITGTQHLVDITAVLNIPQLRDRLKKYPQLQVFKVTDDMFVTGFSSNVFYKSVLIYTQQYNVTKSKLYANSSLYTTSPVPPDTIPINLRPSVSSAEAIQIAKQQMNFNDNCIAFRLCIFDVNTLNGSAGHNYRLAWMVQNIESGIPRVMVDAVNKNIIETDDGIR